MAAKMQKIIEKVIDSQRFETLVTLYANTPTRKPEKTVKDFLPNLFTNRPQTILPRTELRLVPIMITETKSIDTRNRCLKNDAK